MNIFNKFFKFRKNKNEKNYTNEELFTMGKKLRNKILDLRMNNTKYNRIIISGTGNIMYLNNKQYIEFFGYNLNRQILSIIVSLDTFIKLYNSSTILFEQTDKDEIYLKEIKDINDIK